MRVRVGLWKVEDWVKQMEWGAFVCFDFVSGVYTM
jgi:hypothetical protein